MDSKVTITDEKLIIGNVEFLHKQARDNCKCECCWNTSLQQRRLNPPAGNIKVTECHIENVSAQDYPIAYVTWSDGHQGILHFERNAIRSMSSKCTADALSSAPLTLWKSPLQCMRQQYNYSDVINCPKQLYNMFQTFLRIGIVQIRNAPLQNESNPGLVEIAEKLGLGPPTSTLFGNYFNVQSKPSTAQLKNQAYTNLPLHLHTDLPFYDTPPELFLFGCVNPSASGGESVYTDGFAAARQLQETHPHYFAILSTVPMIHRDDTAAWQMMSLKPLIQLHADGSLHRVEDNPSCRDSNMYWNPPHDWYEAYSVYRGIVEDATRHFHYAMVPGDITIFDNWRVYHGRNGFPTGDDDSSSSGQQQRALPSRFMTGLYVARTHFHSAVRMLEAGNETATASLESDDLHDKAE